MSTKIFIILGFSFFSLLAYEYFYQKNYLNRELPLPLGFTMILINIVLTVSAAFGGALIAQTLWPVTDENSARFARLVGIVSGIWVVRILSQVGQNTVRARLGMAQVPLVWMRTFGGKKKRRG